MLSLATKRSCIKLLVWKLDRLSRSLRDVLTIMEQIQEAKGFENQRYRASGLNLIVAAITLWNTVYLERAVAAFREHGITINDESLAHLSSIGWEHINLIGDYTWQAAGRLRRGAFKPLRPFAASNE